MADDTLDPSNASSGAPKLRRTGAPKGNRNATKRGLRSKLLSEPAKLAVLGTIGKGFVGVTRHILAERRSLETEVLEAHGEISPTSARLIQTAIRWSRHALFAQKLLRDKWDTLTPDQQLAFHEQIAKASESRDRVVAKLGLESTAKPIMPSFTPLGSKPVAPQQQFTHPTAATLQDADALHDADPAQPDEDDSDATQGIPLDG